MHKNTSRRAWIILLTSFFVCVTLAVAAPLSIRWFVANSTIDAPGLLRVTAGTVLLITDGSDDPLAVVDARQVEPGTLIQSGQNSSGNLAFSLNRSDDSPDAATAAAVQLYPAARLLLAESTQPRFSANHDAPKIALEMYDGRVRINTAKVTPVGLQFSVQTPHALIDLGAGSFAVQVNVNETQVASRIGQATVSANGASVVVADGAATTVADGAAPTEPAIAADNLISNGNFEDPLGPPHWLVTQYPEDDPSAGQAETVEVTGRNAVRFSRINQQPIHTEIGITQVLNEDVLDYEMVNLLLDVQLIWQSLPGAGELSSEFPLMFRLDYEDIYGNHQFWTHGFYYRDPPAQWVVTGGEKIPANVWFPFESGNLSDRLVQEGLPPPATLNYLKIYASGHNYDSLAAEVRMIAR
jgi:hypothetical protein